MVVDDDFDSCDSVSYMLEQIGMRAEWTLSGKEAILRTHQAVVRNDVYTVYIIDWMLVRWWRGGYGRRWGNLCRLS